MNYLLDIRPQAERRYKRLKRILKTTFAKKKNQRKAIYIASAVLIASLGLSLIALQSSKHQSQVTYQHKLIKRQRQLKSLEVKLNQTQQLKAQSDAEVQAKAQHEADLQKQIDDLNKQLQAKAAQQSIASRAVNTVTRTQTAYAAPVASYSGCGDNIYAQFIYQHESGCNLNAVNASGCRGIGQACPGSKLPCGADYACQNAYFTNYANKYGGWAGAYSFWLAHRWW